MCICFHNIGSQRRMCLRAVQIHDHLEILKVSVLSIVFKGQ